MDDNKKCYWSQIIHTVPRAWKKMYSEYGKNDSNFFIHEHHLIKKHQIYCLEKLKARELNNMQLILNVEQPTAETYFQENFKNPEWDWKDIYTLPRLVTMITNICKFEYRLLHNILNEMLHKIGRRVSPLYSFLHGRA